MWLIVASFDVVVFAGSSHTHCSDCSPVSQLPQTCFGLSVCLSPSLSQAAYSHTYFCASLHTVRKLSQNRTGAIIDLLSSPINYPSLHCPCGQRTLSHMQHQVSSAHQQVCARIIAYATSELIAAPQFSLKFGPAKKNFPPFWGVEGYSFNFFSDTAWYFSLKNS